MTSINQKPALNFWKIWNMCFGFFGIQFGFALQNANIGRIFQTLGAQIDELPILFLAAPVTGLLMQPLIGYLSDKTWTRLGRRRPYFLTGAILATLALWIIPNSTALWATVVFLWLLNSAINISMEPFRSFVCDMLPNEQRTRGFAVQAFFIGIGSVIASALPWMFTNLFGVSNTAPNGMIPDSVIYSFYLGGFAFIAAILVTVISTREYSPEELAHFEAHEIKLTAANNRQQIQIQTFPFLTSGLFFTALGAVVAIAITQWKLAGELYVLAAGSILFGVLQLITQLLKKNSYHDNGLVEVMTDLVQMPKAMRQLAWVQFFSWFALFSLWIYSVAAVTEYHYGTSNTSSEVYNQAANWVGVLFSSYNGFAALAALLIPLMARKTNRKIAHMINLCLGAAGLISFYFIKDPKMLLFSMVGVGFAWASILSMPYAMLAGSLPANKAGIYMGIFNLFITIPQILASTILGLMMRSLFGGQAIFALVCGGVSLFIAALMTLFVEDKNDLKP